jgi:hypothetical protein
LKRLSSSVVHINNNELHTLKHVVVRKSFIPRFVEESNLVYCGKKKGGEFITKSKKKSKLENGFQDNTSNGTKCVEWTYIPFTTIPIMKTNVSLAKKSTNKTGNGGRGVVVRECKDM